mgnify:CR=1 FL=1|jgi:hypothetical protein
MDNHFISLQEKLALLPSLGSIELTPEESIIYGIEYLDHSNQFKEGDEDE